MSAQPESEAAPSPLIGHSIGKYKLTRLIGMGGMGAVYEAVHESINQRVAVKVMHPKLTTDKEAVQRFINEAKTTSLVHHVGLVKVHDFGELEDGSTYMMMEYLEGESLRARLAKVKKLSTIDALRIVRQIAAALAAAHEKGIVHRDLKPENVLMVPDPETSSGERAKVLDFGIAKLVDPGEGEVLKTTTGAILGTPTYMSPEQCRGVGKVTDKADVYSLGCMLYQMLAGRVPFVGHGAGDLIAMHIMEAPEPLRSLAPDIAPEVEVLVHQLLEKKPEQRPSMRQVLNSLEQLGHGSTSSGHGSVIIVQAPAGAGRTSEIKRRSPLPIVLGAVGLVLIGGIAIVASHRPQVVTPPVKPVVSDPPPRPADAKVAAAPGAVTLSVTSDPVGAQVLSSPELKPLGGTPWRIERLPSQGKLEVVIRLPGYFDQKLVFDGIHDDARAIKLAVTPAAAPDPGKRPGPAVKKPWQKPAGKPAGPASTKKKGDEDVDVPVVR